MTKAKSQILVDKDLLDTCLWSSIRYFIGRHTIAAAYHAADIANLLSKNPDIISPERRKFLAKDIRSCISDVIRFHNNCQVYGFSDHVDAVTLMCTWLADYLKQNNLTLSFVSDGSDESLFNPNRYKWTIDLGAEQVSIERLEFSKIGLNTFASDITDLTPWIKLAGYLDSNKRVTYKQEGKEAQSDVMFAFPVYGTYLEDNAPHFFMGYCTPSQYVQSPHMDSYLAPEAIVSVESLYKH